MMLSRVSFLFVLPRTPWFYTLSLHDALPISGHVGMERRHAPPQAGDRQRVADHAAVCKCTQHLPARMCGHHEHGDRLHLQIRLAPDLALEFHATVEFLERLAFAHQDVPAHLRAWALANSRLHAFPSASFVASHLFSTSTMTMFLSF